MAWGKACKGFILITLQPQKNDVIVGMVCLVADPHERHKKGLKGEIVNHSNHFCNNYLLTCAKFFNFNLDKASTSLPPLCHSNLHLTLPFKHGTNNDKETSPQVLAKDDIFIQPHVKRSENHLLLCNKYQI